MTISDQEKIESAFALLRHQGYACYADWECCQSCGWAAIAEIHPNTKRAVFYHHQDAASLGPFGMLTDTLYLAWAGDGEQIVRALRDAGLRTTWNGNDQARIAVMPDLIVA